MLNWGYGGLKYMLDLCYVSVTFLGISLGLCCCHFGIVKPMVNRTFDTKLSNKQDVLCVSRTLMLCVCLMRLIGLYSYHICLMLV